MNKRISLLAAALLLAAPGAMAATGDWTGWYAGIHAGQGSGDFEVDTTLGGAWSSETQALRDDVTANMSPVLDGSGTAYGLQLGYNHQFASGFVLGGEIDWSRLGIDEARSTGPTPTTPFPTLTYDYGNVVELDDKLAIKARMGWASGSHLFFVSAGWVQVDAQSFASIISNGNYLKAGADSETLSGTELGLGYEYDFGNQWTLRGEWLMADVDRIDYDTGYLAGSAFTDPAYTESVRQDADFEVLRLALNYRF